MLITESKFHCLSSAVHYSVIFVFVFWLCWVFVAARGLFSGCGEQGLLFVVVRGLLIAVASLAEHRLYACGLQELWHTGFRSCGTRA